MATSAASRPRPIDGAADAPLAVVARVERVPAVAEVDLGPGAEVHRCAGVGHGDVGQVADDVAGGDVEGPAHRDGEVGEVAADTGAVGERVGGRLGRRRRAVGERRGAGWSRRRWPRPAPSLAPGCRTARRRSRRARRTGSTGWAGGSRGRRRAGRRVGLAGVGVDGVEPGVVAHRRPVGERARARWQEQPAALVPEQVPVGRGGRADGSGRTVRRRCGDPRTRGVRP